MKEQIQPVEHLPTLKDDDELLHSLARFLGEATSDGLYPLVAYSLANELVYVLTTTIPDLPSAIRILEDVSPKGYNLGFTLRPDLVQRLANENPHVFRLKEHQFHRIHEIEMRRIGRLVSTFGAPFYEQKGFALIDICGFSRLNHSDQLAQLYSLTNAVDSSIGRTENICRHLRLPNRFGRTSTGDGFYLWHDSIGGHADVASFFLLVCILTQSEAMRRNGFPMRLRASYVIGSAFMLYEAETRSNPSAPASNAVGAATNIAARFVATAKPSQILLGNFSRQGQPGEQLEPATLLTQVNELFRDEGFGAASLVASPKKVLRVDDKHGDAYYCWNVVGEVPNQIGRNTSRVKIGVHPDGATPINQLQFAQE